MGRTCFVKNCKKFIGKHKSKVGISFHRFPHDISKRQEWIRRIDRRRNDGSLQEPGKYDTVCGNHFKPTCYMSDGKKPLLSPHAIPTECLGDGDSIKELQNTLLVPDTSFMVPMECVTVSKVDSSLPVVVEVLENHP